ncbi:MAG: sensor histidine kinase, partial [Planctomycetota bacterium]
MLDRALAERAREEGRAVAHASIHGRAARVVVIAARGGFGVLAFEEETLRHAAFAFAKVLFTDSAICLLYVAGLYLTGRARPVFLFRHRVALGLVLLSVPPVLLLAAYNEEVVEERYEEEVSERLRRRLDLAETLLRDESRVPDNAWCTAFAADHRADLNVYRDDELVATSRPGVWDTGMLARRLSARAYVDLHLKSRSGTTDEVYFGRPEGLRMAYRKVRGGWGDPPVTLAAPALDDRSALERRAAAGNALLLAAYLLTATLTVFLALFFARSVTAPVRRLQEATRKVAAGDLEATLPEGRGDEFGDLVRAFNRMTRELRDAQELRVRAEKEAAWREMARQVAHEIKNPLTPLKLTIQNLLAAHREGQAGFTAEFEAGSQRMLEQIEALRRIANEFSAYARFPSRQVAPVEVNALLDDVAALYAAGGGVVAERAPAPLVVDADRDELRRALINLVANSRQAGARRVVLRGRREDGLARIEVEDDGSGIAPELMPRLFQPAFTTKRSGTGLGLAIVKRIVDDLGGTIDVRSEPGRGTTVAIVLPRRP